MNLSVGVENQSLWIIRPLAISMLNIPYIYGGKSPINGLDCSGVVCELLQSLGLIGRNVEMNSQMIFDNFKNKSAEGVIALGSLAFYGESASKISHVAMFLDTHFIIEAGHGTSDTKEVSQAQIRDAKVRISPFNYRKDLVAVLRPKFEDYGLHD